MLNVSPKAVIVNCKILAVRKGGPGLRTVKVLRLGGCRSRCLQLHGVFRQILKLVSRCRPSRLTVRTPFFKGGMRDVLGLKHTRKITVTTTLRQSVPVFRCTPLGVGVSVAKGKGTTGRRITKVLRHCLRVPRTSVLPRLSTASKLTTTIYRCFRAGGPVRRGGCAK